MILTGIVFIEFLPMVLNAGMNMIPTETGFTKKSNVSGNSSDESLCEYEYDDKGNKLHSKSSGADGDFEEWFEYDSENRMTRNRNSYGIDNYYEYIFNGDIILTRQNNEVVSIHENDSDGKHSYTRSSRGTTSISETDDDGNLIYYSNSLGYKKWYIYDSSGNLTHTKDSNGYENWYSYVFDSDGKIKSCAMYESAD